MNTVTVTVSGSTGSGKSAVMGEILIALRALGLEVSFGPDFQTELNMTHGDFAAALDLYRPKIELREVNTPRRALTGGEG